MATLFILEQLKWSPIITSAPTFVIVPIIFLICLILYMLVPETIGNIKKNLEKRLKDKNQATSYEMKTLEQMTNFLNNKNEELSQNKSIKIKQLDIETATNFAKMSPKEEINENIIEEVFEELFSDGKFVYKKIGKAV